MAVIDYLNPMHPRTLTCLYLHNIGAGLKVGRPTCDLRIRKLGLHRREHELM